MTKKRYRKLARAYFTRLNEWAKANNSTPMDMGELYKVIAKLGNPTEMSRAEWWARLAKGEVFGVGERG